MGVEARVVVYARSEAEGAAAARAAYGRIGELEQALSDYRASSDLMRVCARAGEGEQVVSADLLHALVRAREIAQATDGAFDPAIGTLTKLWRGARRTGALADQSELEAARERAGYRHLRVDAARGVVELDRAGVLLDLGGIAKGLAAAEAVRTLREHGCASALVALAGDIAMGEAPPGALGWRVRVEPWSGEAGEGAGADGDLVLANCSISTSGGAEQRVEIDGVAYAHIVDPATGLGISRRCAATVISDDGAAADALATAVCVAGPTRARELMAVWTRRLGLDPRRTHAMAWEWEIERTACRIVRTDEFPAWGRELSTSERTSRPGAAKPRAGVLTGPRHSVPAPVPR